MTRLEESPGWRRLLTAARRSLERTGGGLDAQVRLSEPDEAERRTVIGITGVHRPAGVGGLTVRLSDVDAYLRAAHGQGLAEILGPLRNRPAERRARTEARDRLLAAAESSRHAEAGWFAEWLAAIGKDGTLGRLASSGADLRPVIKVLDALPLPGEPMPVAAERLLGDTKAFSEGRIRGLVLGALRAWHRSTVDTGPVDDRELWEWAGIVPDDLASQVLVLNLPAEGGLLADWLNSAAAAAVPLRVTLHQLRLAPVSIRAGRVFVTENPAVLRAAADALGPACPPLVCTEGVPSAAVHRLLAAAGDAEIRWRNDFDWTGVRVTGSALARYENARAWRMTAADYRSAGATGIPLLGAPAPTSWDPALAEAMERGGRAVMEERLLPALLADLRG